MKIVVLKEVPGLGYEDDVAEVSEGYARNYLFPRRLAELATPAALAGIEKRKEEREKKLAEKRTEFSAQAETLAAQEINITMDAGEEGKLFGSVTPQMIADAIKAACQIEIDKRKIELADPIKLLGDYMVTAKLFRDITAKIKVKVSAK
ncbi:MAG: 50S ribosomal protein L9 [Candidatus Margulisiibacteriota bacterium]